MVTGRDKLDSLLGYLLNPFIYYHIFEYSAMASKERDLPLQPATVVNDLFSGLQNKSTLLAWIQQFYDQGILSTQDIRALRLANRSASHLATRVLFSSIRISQLDHDRLQFLQICNASHLAIHVQTVDWQEISWTPGYFRCIHNITERKTADASENDEVRITDDMDAICSRLDAVASDQFWMYALHDEDKSKAGRATFAHILRQRTEAKEEFRWIFRQLLMTLPGLKHLRSRPMPRRRVLAFMNPPISVRLLQTHHTNFRVRNRAGQPIRTCRKSSPHEDLDGMSLRHMTPNDGLVEFILPALWENDQLPNDLGLSWQEEIPGCC